MFNRAYLVLPVLIPADMRVGAIQVLDKLYRFVGQKAFDQILPPLLDSLQHEGSNALDGLRQILTIKSSVVLPFLVSKLLTPPITSFNVKAFASLPKCPAPPPTSISTHSPTLLGAIAASGDEADSIAMVAETIVLAVGPTAIKHFIGRVVIAVGLQIYQQLWWPHRQSRYDLLWESRTKQCLFTYMLAELVGKSYRLTSVLKKGVKIIAERKYKKISTFSTPIPVAENGLMCIWTERWYPLSLGHQNEGQSPPSSLNDNPQPSYSLLTERFIPVHPMCGRDESLSAIYNKAKVTNFLLLNWRIVPSKQRSKSIQVYICENEVCVDRHSRSSEMEDKLTVVYSLGVSNHESQHQYKYEHGAPPKSFADLVKDEKLDTKRIFLLSADHSYDLSEQHVTYYHLKILGDEIEAPADFTCSPSSEYYWLQDPRKPCFALNKETVVLSFLQKQETDGSELKAITSGTTPAQGNGEQGTAAETSGLSEATACETAPAQENTEQAVAVETGETAPAQENEIQAIAQKILMIFKRDLDERSAGFTLEYRIIHKESSQADKSGEPEIVAHNEAGFYARAVALTVRNASAICSDYVMQEGKQRKSRQVIAMRTEAGHCFQKPNGAQQGLINNAGTFAASSEPWPTTGGM
ncbi:putative Translational activator GCN1 [Planoprotostelium fungivorum]|uniref:Putative Translational activator GCN1 n=1 Tax=Planoprotostelium fungivorum TaxID=1890364 RepID=A0A2P6MS25_9EUKA|nr:putative Translational activator GCN1 [Planoprotostelium fungivorum]